MAKRGDKNINDEGSSENRDPISGAAGAHPVDVGGGGEEAQHGPGLDLPTSEKDLSMKNSPLETTGAGFDESGRSLDAATAPRAGERGNAAALRDDDDDADLH
jgi:hypothetical protein